MRQPIVVIGSSNTDMIVRVARLPRAGETVLGGRFQTAAGGKGANQAVAAARAGGKVTFVGRVGQDVLGRQALAALRLEHIDASYVVVDRQEPSGVALICVEPQGENSIAVAGGANLRLARADVQRAQRVVARAGVLLLQLETPIPTLTAAARLATQSGTLVILNPAPAQPLADALLRRVAVLTPNESEAELLTGVRLSGPAAAKRAALDLLKRGVQAVVMTLGAKGALIADKDGTRVVGGFAVKVVDTTAAGDTFNGALAVALTEGQGLDHAVRFANAAAALSVTRAGAQPSVPHRRAIDRFLSRQ